MSIVVIGERRNARPWRPADPKKEMDPRFLLKMGAFNRGTAWRFMHDKVGLRWNAAMNLLMPTWAGGEDWRSNRAEEVARACAPYLEKEFDCIVLTGRRVAQAFGKSIDFLERDGKYFSLPHPSGLNRWWNDAKNLEKAQRVCAELVEEYLALDERGAERCMQARS